MTTDTSSQVLAVQAENAGREWERKSHGDDSLSIDEMFEHWYSPRYMGNKEIQRHSFLSGFSAERFPERYSQNKRCEKCGCRVNNLTKVPTCQHCRALQAQERQSK